MSKRQAQFQGGGERYGGPVQTEEMDKPRVATAAQLANRKIAQAKGSRRPRSESPLTGPGSTFGQANQNGGSTMAPSNPFSSTPSFAFGNSNANGSSQSFGSGGGSFNFGGGSGQQTQQSTPNTNSSFTFGGAGNAPSSSLQFGQTPAAASTAAPPTNGFGNTNSSFNFGSQQNGDAAQGLFGNATPKASSPAIFGAGDQTPKPLSNPFGAAQDSNKSATTSIFGNNASAQNGSNGFVFGNNGSFGQNAAGTSQTPSSTTFGGFGSTQASQVEKPATDGWASFLNQKPAETAKVPATNGFNPSTTSLFNSQPNGQTNGSTSNVFAGFQSQVKTPNFKFTAQPEDNDASMMSPENTPQKPNTGGFAGINGIAKEPVQTSVDQTPKPALGFGKGTSLFDRISKDDSKEVSQPAQNLFGSLAAPSTTPAKNLFAPQQAAKPVTPATSNNTIQSNFTPTTPAATTVAQSSMSATKPEHFSNIRELNEALLQHLKSQDLNRDMSSIFKYYQQEIAKVHGNLTTSSPSKPAAATTPATFGKSTTQSDQISYPTLPQNASNTAKLFEAALDKPVAPIQSFKPSTTSLFTPATVKSAEHSTSSSLFGARTAEIAPKPTGFTPSASQPATTSSIFAPKAAAEAATKGFLPTLTPSASSNFLSSFGQQAAANAEKEKKRRRDEDFDSEEENEAEWEKRDAEEQEAKRSKLESAAKASTGFKFVPTSKPAVASTTDSAQGSDHTWQQGTPIKFGGATTTTTTTSTTTSTTPVAPTRPVFGHFGAASFKPATSVNASSLFSNAPKPTTTFSFGQTSSTPTVTNNTTEASTDQAEAAGEDGDAAPPEAQLDDMAVLLASEKEESDVVFYVEKSKSRKLEARAAEGGTEKLTWLDKGKGPIWILRNKTTGKTRVLQKIKDSGRTAMNFTIIPGSESLYKHEGMNGKAVMATFIDHLGNKDVKKPSQWAIIVASKEDAEQITKILREEQKKA